MAVSGIPISRMNLADTLLKNDRIEISRIGGAAESDSTMAATIQQIQNFCKKANNGSFMGITNEDLNSFSSDDAGVYYWEGTPPLTGMPSAGMLEVVTYFSDDSAETPTVAVFERLTANDQCFIRSQIAGMWSNWGVLSNKNGNIIFSGVANGSEVVFPVPFDVAPVVVVTPCGNQTPNDTLHVINIGSVNTNKFTVARYTCSLGQYVETETINTTEQSGTTTTKTYNRQVTGYAWSAGDFSYYWIATLDG